MSYWTSFFAAILIVVDTQAQWEWEYGDPEFGYDHMVVDAVELQSGFILGSVAFNSSFSLPSYSRLSRIDMAGVEDLDHRLGNNESAVLSCMRLAYDPDGIVTYTRMSGPQTEFRLVRHALTHDFQAIDSVTYAFGSPYHLGMDNIVTRPDGEDLLLVYGQSGPSSRFIGEFIRVDQNGNELQRTLHGAGQSDLIPRSGFATDDGYMTGVLGAIEGSGLTGRTTLVKLSPSLELAGGISGFQIHGDSTLPLAQNTITDQITAIPIGDQHLVISGRTGNLTTGQGVAVAKLTVDGTFVSSFVQRSSFPHDQIALFEGMCLDSDGNILLAHWENVEVADFYRPTQASRVVVQKLDTNLTLLCTTVIDGFESSTYYWLNRIKATSDGGFLLLGGKRGLSLSDRFLPWAEKFSASDCITTVADQTQDQSVEVFPNPGTDGFTLLISGPSIPSATIQLLDAMGRVVATGPLLLSKGWLSTAHLAPGVYHYQVLGIRNTMLAQGKWVRE